MGESRKTNSNKLDQVELFYQPEFDVPLVAGSAAWLICKVLPETEFQQKYDMFLADVVGAWADDRVFSNGHWLFDNTLMNCAPCTTSQAVSSIRQEKGLT
jgi:hypothetical protein